MPRKARLEFDGAVRSVRKCVNVRAGILILGAVTAASILLLTACGDRLSPAEQEIVGAWSWNYISGVGRIIFTADREVKQGFPPDEKDGRKIADHEFKIFWAGTWRIETDVLVTEMDNGPVIKIMEQLDPSNCPPFEKRIERRKIVNIDGNKVVFDNGQSLNRVKR